MRVLLINKFGPPSDAPTARVINQLSAALRQLGHEPEIIESGGTYRGSRRGLARAVDEMVALGRLCLKLVWSRPSERWIVLSSPPGVLIPAAIAGMLRRARMVHWVMDLYPDTAVSLGLLRENSLPDRVFRGAMHWAMRRCGKVFVLDSDMQRRIPMKTSVMPLWPLEKVPVLPPEIPGRTWVYSGNLGRAHEWQTLLQAQRIIESRHCGIRLVFQARGAEIARAKASAGELGLRDIEWSELAPAESFAESIQRAGTLIVTQRLEARGCVWPSKLAVAARVSRPLLWVGPAGGAVAEWLSERPGAGLFKPGEADAVADWVEQWCAKELPADSWAAWLQKHPANTPGFAVQAFLA